MFYGCLVEIHNTWRQKKNDEEKKDANHKVMCARVCVSDAWVYAELSSVHSVCVCV